jgi:hypothetical protein
MRCFVGYCELVKHFTPRLDEEDQFRASNSSSSLLSVAPSSGSHNTSLDILDVPNIHQYLFDNYLDWPNAVKLDRLRELYDNLQLEERRILEFVETFADAKRVALTNLNSMKATLDERESQLLASKSDITQDIQNNQKEVEKLTSKVSAGMKSVAYMSLI